MTFKFPFTHFIVSGDSMAPTLKMGEHVISFNWLLRPKVGDLVVAKVNNRSIIKRIKKIKGGRVYLIGDNKEKSIDSRDFGEIDKSDIIGQIIFF